MRISEIYQSLQGEGLLTGTPSIFVRTSGCNLRCWFCDTPFTSWQPEGEDEEVDAIVDQVQSFEAKHVVITGGEPLLWRDLPELCQRLRCLQYHITIETAGTIYQELACDLMSISPKLSNSTPTVIRSKRWHSLHERRRYRPETIQRLMSSCPYQLKFVIDQIEDLEEVIGVLADLPEVDLERVLMMPQGVEVDDLERRAEWLIPWCRSHGVQFCERAHIRWYGAVRGT